ncbi:MAG: hypothetical protein HOG74_05765 [Nitrospina sp.]|jgi:hypothetical protein|nr:hypothetical protein [Nitrospina sp.]
MKNFFKFDLGIVAFVLAVVFISTGIQSSSVFAKSDSDELKAIKDEFGSVLSLKGAARKEINTIANLFAPGSKLAAIDITNASGEYCMLEKVTKHNMIHYSSRPEKTHEDVVYYLNPKTFIDNGLDVSKLPRQPKSLGEMTPLQWYYYDGTYVEPHQGTKMNKEFVIMTVNVK